MMNTPQLAAQFLGVAIFDTARLAARSFIFPLWDYPIQYRPGIARDSSTYGGRHAVRIFPDVSLPRRTLVPENISSCVFTARPDPRFVGPLGMGLRGLPAGDRRANRRVARLECRKERVRWNSNRRDSPDLLSSNTRRGGGGRIAGLAGFPFRKGRRCRRCGLAAVRARVRGAPDHDGRRLVDIRRHRPVCLRGKIRQRSPARRIAAPGAIRTGRSFNRAPGSFSPRDPGAFGSSDLSGGDALYRRLRRCIRVPSDRSGVSRRAIPPERAGR